VWLTPHPRDLNQPEGERVYIYIYTVFQKKFTLLVFTITKLDVDKF